MVCRSCSLHDDPLRAILCRRPLRPTNPLPCPSLLQDRHLSSAPNPPDDPLTVYHTRIHTSNIPLEVFCLSILARDIEEHAEPID